MGVSLSNDQAQSVVVGALRLVETHGHRLIPNIAAILLLGREEIIQRVLPTHQVYFQVLDAQGAVKANEEFHGPLIKVIQELESRFAVRNEEKEMTFGLFRLPIPDYSPLGFREVMNNALLHRDYTRMDAIYIQWHPDYLQVTSAGGFPPGVTLDNLLIHEPKPRNPRLAETFRRLGLVEQTGRGIDKIYLEQLRFGRPVPDYHRSDTSGVRVVLHGGEASLSFAAFVYEQDRDGRPLTLEELMILNALCYDRRIDTDQAGKLIQKGTEEGRIVLERLRERGIIDADDEKRGRSYHLSTGSYRKFEKSVDYVRAHGISEPRREALVLEYVHTHGRIERKDVVELCDLSKDQAGRLLTKLAKEGKLVRQGNPPRWTYYELPSP